MLLHLPISCSFSLMRKRVPSRVMRKFVCKLWLNEVSQQ